MEANGERRPIQPGEVLFVEGGPSESFYVVLAGRVAMVEGYGTDEQRVVRVTDIGCGPGTTLTTMTPSGGSAEKGRRLARRIAPSHHHNGIVDAQLGLHRGGRVVDAGFLELLHARHR
ncbi:MAG TPA: hypothetical protein VN327_10090 [Pseudonocardiaceae bacterium]|nr:hypothetical protein [Pseudonocardiaceae bacterium]